MVTGFQGKVKELNKRAVGERVSECGFCKGTGVVSYWSECLNFEDRRFCPRCETGESLAEKLAQTVARVSAEERSLAVKGSQFLKALP